MRHLLLQHCYACSRIKVVQALGVRTNHSTMKLRLKIDLYAAGWRLIMVYSYEMIWDLQQMQTSEL